MMQSSYLVFVGFIRHTNNATAAWTGLGTPRLRSALLTLLGERADLVSSKRFAQDAFLAVAIPYADDRALSRHLRQKAANAALVARDRYAFGRRFSHQDLGSDGALGKVRAEDGNAHHLADLALYGRQYHAGLVVSQCQFTYCHFDPLSYRTRCRRCLSRPWLAHRTRTRGMPHSRGRRLARPDSLWCTTPAESARCSLRISRVSHNRARRGTVSG